MKKQRLVVTVSGGRTSMYMAIRLRELYSDDYEMLFIFANTGMEHEDTLRFLHDAETALNIPFVWVESVVHHGIRKASTHKVVSFKTASRKGEVFEDVISKYGIPSVGWMHCTRELKMNPIDSYIKTLGWTKKNSERAIGIRADETRRVAKNATKDRIIYPLIDMFPTDKENVLDYMSQFSWNLRIPEWLGNCRACYKKSYNKLSKVYADDPKALEWTGRMERLYGRAGTWQEKHPDEAPSTFFRGKKSTENMIKMFNFTGQSDAPEANLDGGCSESCEMYPMVEIEVISTLSKQRGTKKSHRLAAHNHSPFEAIGHPILDFLDGCI